MKNLIEIKVGENSIKIETNKWAKQSNGSAKATYKDNVILTTANMRNEPAKNQGFFPLMVDFRENNYAAGMIPGGFFKREGKPSEREVLLSRLIDRPIRPLFPDSFMNETQIISNLLSADFSIDYDSLAIISTSAALLTSTIPFSEPVSAIKIGSKDGEFFLNPGRNDQGDFDMIIQAAGTKEHIVMLEAEGDQFGEDLFIQGLELAKKHIKDICEAQMELINPDKLIVEEDEEEKKIYEELNKKYAKKINDAIFSDRDNRHEELAAVKEEIIADNEEDADLGKHFNVLHKIEYEQFRATLLKDKKRTDNRDFDTIRDITCEISVLPRVHGSAVFTRGETQALATTTLGCEDDAKRLDDFSAIESNFKRFMLHYNFPPFSVGEVKFLRGTGRREIGHGNLAEKALKPVIPATDDFAYTIRLVSDVLESNGSSSMATVCGGTLSLMNAGVPIKAPVSGIAMGLVKEGDDFQILTDIAGYEDHFGDMDFKLAGTEEGITAIQLDIKIGGLSDEIIRKTLEKAKKARLFILEKIKDTIAAPNKNISVYAPVITQMKIDPKKVKDVIGPGGKVVKGFISEYGVKINIEDDGTINIAAPDVEVSETVQAKIEELTKEAEVNAIYPGTITRIEEYGLFVELFKGTTGLMHISDLKRSNKTVKDFKLGDKAEVKVLSVDRIRGRIKIVFNDGTADSNPRSNYRDNDRPKKRY